MIRLFLLSPTVAWRARVNMASVTFPLDEIQFDTETVGSYQDTSPGQTVLLGSAEGLDDLGRQRVRKQAIAGTLYVGRSSQGNRDGELGVVDDAFLTVVNLRQVWTKTPLIIGSTDPPGIFKDSSEPLGSNTILFPPVANCGPGYFATIDGSNIITAEFDGTASFTVADGATITGYAWDIDDGTLVAGYALTDSVIQVEFGPGFRYVSLTITDSNARTHTAYCPVFARDPADDACISAFQIAQHRITPEGQQISVRVLEDIPIGTYPDGTLAMIADGEPATAADRSNLLFYGWHQADPAEIQAQRTGTLKNTTLELLDIAGRLDTLPGFPQEVSNAETPTNWSEMNDATVDRYTDYLIRWHSNALDLADWTPSGTGSTYAFPILGSDGESLWDQADSLCRNMIPDRRLTCNTLGQLQVLPDPWVQDVADRTAVNQFTMDESYWSAVRYQHIRAPRIHWLRGGAILADTRYAAAVSKDNPLNTVFCIAPGDAPGMGLGEQTDEEAVAVSQATLNSAMGHRYARTNAPEGHYTFTLSRGSTHGIEPADMTPVRMTIPASVAAQRGLNFTNERGLVYALNVRYNYARTGVTVSVEMEWERETVGTPAVTVVQEEAATNPGGLDDDYWTSPVFTEPEGTDAIWYGDPKAYILWNSAHVIRTWDISAASPTWELVDTGISGTIYDAQYVHVDSDTVGMWLMTSTGIYWCADILATTPSWTEKLTIATVQASDPTPSSGSVVFQAMANYATEPGYLIVFTGPNTEPTDYLASMTWHTHDYGDNWTSVDMGFTETDFGATRGYCIASLYGAEIFRSAPGTIYVVRAVPLVASSEHVRVFKSTDLGDTWSKDYQFIHGENNYEEHSLLHPFPDATDPSYVFYGQVGVTERPDVWISTDEWGTATQRTPPSGYGGVSGFLRPNKRTYVADHLLAWHRESASPNHYKLLGSEDRGVTWSLLYNSGAGEVTVTTPRGNVSTAAYNTPNGWPGDPDENTWFLVRTNGSLASPFVIALTTDYFATTPVSKEGNLSTILGGTWNSGAASGVALPKVGSNS